MREFLNRTLEMWSLIRRIDQPNTKLAIFVHGFRGDYLTTWGKLPSLIEANADRASPFDSWDYYFLGYPTRRVGTYLDISGLIETAWRAAYAGTSMFAQKYKHLALFGHSLGTLGIRQLLCTWQPAQFGRLDVLQSVTFFGSPLSGSPWAGLGLVLGYPIADALTQNNPQLRMLRSWWEHSPVRMRWPSARLVLGTDDRVVGFQQAELINWSGDQPRDLFNYDHRTMTKPNSWSDPIIRYIAAGRID